jgi:iron complex transport system ATP-binding protein
VLSTHDIEHAIRYADRLWLMDREHRFAEGAPEDLAVSGTIGRAFDGDGFRFDAASGAFRAIERGMPFAIELRGPDSSAKKWAARLAERMGLVVSRDAESELEIIASVEIRADGESFGIRASIPEARELVAASYGELARQLSEIIVGRSRG